MELRRDLSLTSLTLTVVTGTIGSGWLFASYYAARTAGPASLPAWLLGGLVSFLLALVFAELGSLINSSGALAQIPLLSHGRLSGFIGGWSIWISYLCVPTIELLAMLSVLLELCTISKNLEGHKLRLLLGYWCSQERRTGGYRTINTFYGTRHMRKVPFLLTFRKYVTLFVMAHTTKPKKRNGAQFKRYTK